MPVLKNADDKGVTLSALEALVVRTDIDARTKKLIEEELWAVRTGIQGERQAAYEIDFQYGVGKNHAVIHDLRVEHGGRTAQIDHLIVNRALDVWICETKAFSQGVKINEHGEWYRYGGGRAHGMASPVKQNQHHVDVLRDLFDSGEIKLPKRGITVKPNLMPVVLVSNEARIDRPKTKAAAERVAGLDTVIKVEHLVETINRSIDERNPLKLIAKLVSADTMMDLGRQMVALHRPHATDWAAKFGVSPDGPPPAPEAAIPAQPGPTCARCSRDATPRVAKYSLDRPELFDGAIYCFDCQNDVRREKQTRDRNRASA